MVYQVIKFDGRREPFSSQKILNSARRVGVPSGLRPKLLKYIESNLRQNMTTKEIFHLIKNFLHTNHQASSLRYNLKKALAELGPSGYPFEKYLAELLKADHYQTQTNQILQGRCVSHEIDVLATKGGFTYAIEAKFHNRKHLRSDVKVSLYVHSRYQDLLANWHRQTKLLPWLVTNTRFTSDARAYAQCVQMRLMSWDFPKQRNLRARIEASRLHPITILETISQRSKEILLQQGVVACRQVLSHCRQLKLLLPSSEYQRLIREVSLLYPASQHES